MVSLSSAFSHFLDQGYPPLREVTLLYRCIQGEKYLLGILVTARKKLKLHYLNPSAPVFIVVHYGIIFGDVSLRDYKLHVTKIFKKKQ